MSSPQQIPNAVDIAQASELTGLSKKALRRRLERGTLDSVKVGGKRMIPISELASHDLLDTRVSEPGPAAAAPTVPESTAAQATSEPSRSTPPSPPEPAQAAPPPSSGPAPGADLAPPSAAAGGSPPPTPDAGAGVMSEAWAQPASTPPPPAPQAMSAQFSGLPAQAPGQVAPAIGAPGYPPGQFVPGQAGPVYGYPDRGGWYWWHEHPALRWLLLLLALAVIGLLVWLLAFRDNGSSAVEPGGGPVGVTQEDLIALSQRVHEPIYWAGTMPGTRMELTETNNSYAYLRYLTGDTPVGDTSPNFLTVGTYPQANAYSNLQGYARGRAHATTYRIQDGGLAVAIPGSPTSVYFAYPHQDVQVEVYDPQPHRALDLVKSGVVRPVISSTSTAGTAPSTTATPTVPTTTPSTPSAEPTVPQG